MVNRWALRWPPPEADGTFGRSVGPEAGTAPGHSSLTGTEGHVHVHFDAGMHFQNAEKLG